MDLFQESLLYRYATKIFDKDKRISPQDLEEILESARLAPSSYGLQPYRYLVISNPQLRSQIKTAAFGQPQVTDASVLIIGQAKTTMTDEDVKTYIEHIAAIRSVSLESLQGFQNMMQQMVVQKGGVLDHLAWSKNQLYLSVGMLLSHAAYKRIDACPMEGFSPAQVDNILNLSDKDDYHSSVMIALGYRDHHDQMSLAKKVRKPLENFLIEI